ncbi:exported hypothetical protein [Candidatus Sulfopaludibacter sp. SbA3]|nr:exported hypothetical protein [Candidatus Sulfopaludibacter sp. SbA3]
MNSNLQLVLSYILTAAIWSAWNHTRFQPPRGNAGDPASFGRMSAARNPRLIQIGFKRP